jgi:hypothetical protein
MSLEKIILITFATTLIIASFLIGDVESTTTCNNFDICGNITASYPGICVSNCKVINCQNTNGGINFCATCNGGGFKYCNSDNPFSDGSRPISSFILVISILSFQLFLRY